MLRKQLKHKMNAKYVQKNIPPLSTNKKYLSVIQGRPTLADMKLFSSKNSSSILTVSNLNEFLYEIGVLTLAICVQKIVKINQIIRYDSPRS